MPLVERDDLVERQDDVPEGVPGLKYPPYSNAQNCPVNYTNIFNQGIQKRASIPISDLESLEPSLQNLNRRAPFKTCHEIGHFTWSGFDRPLGNTEDVFFYGGSTYFFSIASTSVIEVAYAWSAPQGSDHYTLIGTGGDGSDTATIQLDLTDNAHVHFEAFSKDEMSSGQAAVFQLNT